MTEQKRIPDEFWDQNLKRYNTHAYFNTISHHHISDYSGDVACDVMIVECEDGRWYIEDSWGGDVQVALDVFNPFKRNSYPEFFPNLESCNRRAAEIVSSITGRNSDELMLND